MGKEIIFTENAPRPVGLYSQAIRCNGFIFVAGQIPLDPVTGVAVTEGVHKETRLVMDNIAAILEAAGSSLAKVVKFTVYLRHIDDAKFVNEVFAERNLAELPARAMVEVSNLPKNVGVEIEAIAEE
ncbi:MAG TPA: Rid family detoxifying hydrolase [Candidatus Goldiibacteriota bacterium]|nr:Rid family detoxifying hydrolase [Candidatus Goldiibacteriota bacterium]